MSAAYKAHPSEELRVQMCKKRLDTGYTVIIGHRRVAAAKLAGLEMLPCTVADMTEKEQISTMLTENMQRSDLTIPEQAYGFQMMIDMGETVDTIAEKSGFSKSTVRHRLEIAKLPQDKVKKAAARQINMADFIALEKVKDPDAKVKLLDDIGTGNFHARLQAALNKQKWLEKREEWLATIRTFAEECPDACYNAGMEYITSYGSWDTDNEAEIPADADSGKYFYRVSDSQISIYRQRDKAEDAKRADADEAKRRADLISATYKGINADHYALRSAFVAELSNAACRQNLPLIAGFVADAVFSLDGGYVSGLNPKNLGGLLGKAIDPGEMEDDGIRLSSCSAVRDAIAASPEKLLFCLAYSLLDGKDQGYWGYGWNRETGSYQYSHKENPCLDLAYDTLTALGYEMSDDEKAMQDGSHGIFQPGYFHWGD